MRHGVRAGLQNRSRGRPDVRRCPSATYTLPGTASASVAPPSAGRHPRRRRRCGRARERGVPNRERPAPLALARVWAIGAPARPPGGCPDRPARRQRPSDRAHRRAPDERRQDRASLWKRAVRAVSRPESRSYAPGSGPRVVRITADEHAVLRVLAAERAQTISDAVRTVLTSAVREEKSRRAA
jgi:hypothetical protein